MFINSYFDTDDFKEPIKRIVENKYYWPIQLGVNKIGDIYIQENKCKL